VPTSPDHLKLPGRWSFLTSHGRVLVRVAADPTATLPDLAEGVGLSERAVQRIVTQLAAAGYLTVARVGRRNRRAVNRHLPLRPGDAAGPTVGQFLDLVSGTSTPD
jgi:Winged helix-turn-helix DNA-binding